MAGMRAADHALEREPTGYGGRKTLSRAPHMEVDMGEAVAGPAVEDAQGDTRHTMEVDNAGYRLVERGH